LVGAVDAELVFLWGLPGFVYSVFLVEDLGDFVDGFLVVEWLEFLAFCAEGEPDLVGCLGVVFDCGESVFELVGVGFCVAAVFDDLVEFVGVAFFDDGGVVEDAVGSLLGELCCWVDCVVWEVGVALDSWV